MVPFQNVKSYISGPGAGVDPSVARNPAVPTSGDFPMSANALSQSSYSLVDPESYESSGFSDSCDSTDDEENEGNGIGYHFQALERTGEQFEKNASAKEPYEELALIEESRLSTNHNSSDEANPAVVAPFRQGGLPILGKEIILSMPTDPSEPSDPGEHRCSKARRSQGGRRRSRKHRHPGPESSLQDQLFEALQNQEQLTQSFFPANSLKDIITVRAVKKELRRHLPPATHGYDLVRNYARQICGEISAYATAKDRIGTVISFRKIFAILVMLNNMTPTVINFLAEGLSDSDLPLKLVTLPTGKYDLQRQDGRRFYCFRDWSQFQMWDFARWQWTTLAQTFEGAAGHRDVNHYPLSPHTILPFTHDQSMGTEEGGGGLVFEVKIHPDHHMFHNQECAYHPKYVTDKRKPEEKRLCACRFAVKSLHSRERSTFNQEVDILKKFSNGRHPHLISLLATYERSHKFYLIFPFAEANLNSYWQKVHPSPCINKATVSWVAEQCKGIANGVVHIHAYESSRSESHLQEPRKLLGHHGDIKPDNVLWFSSPATAAGEEAAAHSQNHQGGILKLTDFGLAGLDTRRTVSRDIGEIAVSRDYCAPEFDVDGDYKPGRQKDMWALGCVYLEFITWLVGGWQLVNEFRTERKMMDPEWERMETSTFFMLQKVPGSKNGREQAVIKPKVTEFINKLHRHPKCTNFIHEFLDMIEHDLLVIKGHDQQQRDRLTSMEVQTRLCHMISVFEKDADYGCKPDPRTS